MTQMDLSEASGVSQQFISLLENGKASVTVDTLNKLALALRVPIDTLLKSDNA
ncbi:MAG: helix-turn-helix transcriptional regulator [Paracoccaceae bacterium]|nr:helix-turn-helix transcriptional regulator [Paracoccaceae bacterium]